MARVKIDIPEKYLFETTLQVRVSDINYGGHLGNDSIQSMLHEARFQFLNALGYKDELSVEGYGMIQADVAIMYQAEAFHGDLIKVSIGIQDIGRSSFDLVYVLSNDSNEKTIARAKTGLVMYDYKKGKAVSIPEGFLAKIQV